MCWMVGSTTVAPWWRCGWVCISCPLLLIHIHLCLRFPQNKSTWEPNNSRLRGRSLMLHKRYLVEKVSEIIGPQLNWLHKAYCLIFELKIPLNRCRVLIDLIRYTSPEIFIIRFHWDHANDFKFKVVSNLCSFKRVDNENLLLVCYTLDILIFTV